VCKEGYGVSGEGCVQEGLSGEWGEGECVLCGTWQG
jgi:hypothetical protein